MEPPLMFFKLLLLFLITISSIRTDETSESGYSGILSKVRQRLLGFTTDSPSSATDPVYTFAKTIPIINYDFNVTFDSSKLKNTISSIGHATSEVGHATKTALKAPLDVLTKIKNSTTDGFTNLQSRSENASLLDIANAIPIINQFGPKIKEISQQIQFIKPGTKWCGNGDIAQDISDTGFFHDIDSCCRAHDLCPENIEAKSAKYNLVNDGSFTRSSCDCDFHFYKCLKEAANPLAIEVGIAYFDILKPLCFRFDFPMIGCKKYFGNTEECLEFEMDLTKAKTYQWFPSPSFAL